MNIGIMIDDLGTSECFMSGKKTKGIFMVLKDGRQEFVSFKRLERFLEHEKQRSNGVHGNGTDAPAMPLFRGGDDESPDR